MDAIVAGKTLSDYLAEVTCKGTQTLPFRGLSPSTEYVACAFGVNAKGKAASPLFKAAVSTTLPGKLEKIEIEIGELTKYTVSVTYTPSTDLLTYYATIIDKAYFDGIGSDEKNLQDDLLYFSLLAEQEKTEVSEIIAKYTHKGVQTLPFENLKPNTEYVAYAFGVNTDGTVTSPLFKELFSTPKPEQSENAITLTVSNIAIDGALVTSATTNDDPYILDVWEASKLENMSHEQIIQAVLASYEGWDIDKDIATRGNDKLDVTGQIKPTALGTDCVALAFGYEAGFVTTDLVVEEFKTKPGEWVDCTFDIEKLSINSRAASFKVVAHDSKGALDKTTPFFFTLITSEQISQIGDTDEAIGKFLTEKIQEEADYFGYPIETYIRLILFRGEKTETYTELTPNSEFYIVAAGVNTNAKVITPVVRSEKYTVPAPSAATVTFSEPVIEGKTVTVAVQAGAGTPKWKAAGMGSSAQYQTDAQIVNHLLSEYVSDNGTECSYTFDPIYDSNVYFFAIGIDADGNPGNLVKLVVPVGN